MSQEKNHFKNNNVAFSALFLACCIFFNSTAMGINAWINWKSNTIISVSKTVSPIQMIESDEMPVSNDQPSIPRQIPGGPDQPEVQSFTPVGISDMVDPFTGDFSYNIPLLDVDGYPLNISYSAGVSMDQEASWVGLGWNLNPGVMNRTLRGLPDDFNGQDQLKKEMNQKANNTLNLKKYMDFELFGFNSQSTGVNVGRGFGINYNNYTGFNAQLDFGVSFPLLNLGKNNSLTASLGFSGSSQSGASLEPNLSFTNKTDRGIDHKISFGSPFNSRQGFESMSIQYNRTKEKSKTVKIDENTTKTNTYNGTIKAASTFNFGNTSFSPKVTMPMFNLGLTFSIKSGSDLSGADLSTTLSGSFSSQWLAKKEINSPAYGYFNLSKGQGDKHAVIDFSRENEGPFTKNTPALPIPCLNYDIFSASGQGVSGNYRAVRQNIGYVFDPTMNTNSVNGNFGAEFNIGSIVKTGVDISLTYSNAHSEAWENIGNQPVSELKYGNDDFYFREANELSVENDTNQLASIGGINAVSYLPENHRKIGRTLNDSENYVYNSPDYKKNAKDPRNQLLYALTNGELKKGFGLQPLHPQAYALSTTEVDHHIGQYTVLNEEGSRYVYGIAAYSHNQKSVSFSVGEKNNPLNPIDFSNGLVQYQADFDNSIYNTKGTENYFNAETTPAYAHSYLLSAVVNADYVDADTIKGPSKGDLGGYLTLDYSKINNYKWRNPYVKDKASYDEGFNTDPNDDKGHYAAGEKELWYVSSIKSKNHIAVFYSSPRYDAPSMDENGNIENSGSSMVKLDSIALFSLPEYESNQANAIPLKVVHFEYNYSLCPEYPLNQNSATEGGKLTLIKVFFTYQKSNKGRFSPYIFDYSNNNPAFNSKSVDRWNNYKPQSGPVSGNVVTDQLRPSDYPYTGLDKNLADYYANAWKLTSISLPSGGKIQVTYESDDYAYVQHKRAHQMFKITGVELQGNNDPSPNVETGLNQAVSVSDNNLKNAKIYFELMPDGNGGYITDIAKYRPESNLVYFKVLAKFGNNSFDFVPGFAEIDQGANSFQTENINGVLMGSMKLKGAKLIDNGNADYNPISVAAIQFGRLQLSQFIPPSNFGNVNDNGSLMNLVDAVVGAFTSYEEFFVGPNRALWNSGIGTDIVIGKSWVRLANPNFSKLGGGYRVKQILIKDAWDVMTQQAMSQYSYGQVYEYKTEDGKSSGVAAYEPELGGDENVFRQPEFFSQRHILAPDERNYQIKPYGEQFFPSANVGYSRVTVKDLPRNNVTRTATGKVVQEFYTAKEFPTIVGRTQVYPKRFKIPALAFYFSVMIDELLASQGFSVETNDMHGKPKAKHIYQEGQSEPISSVLYEYQADPYYYDGAYVKRLKNHVKTIDRNGKVETNRIGLQYEAFADFRKSTSTTVFASAQFNINALVPYIYLPSLYPSGGFERTAFRSATFTKVIERFGILSNTIAKDLNSVVQTSNLAYDKETGSVLLSKTQTNFNDEVYNLVFPAHWYYDQMGQACQNIDNNFSGIFYFNNGGANQLSNFALNKGDEVALTFLNGVNIIAWVTDATENGIKILAKDGTPIQGTVTKIKVLRSGRKNLQTTPIANITLRENPLNTISGNLYQSVLQASATEFNDEWRTFCECFLNDNSEVKSTNPYVLGTKGTWRPVTSFTHLSGRNQTFKNENSNIRDDGFMTSFSPFFKLINKNWVIDKQNWTYVSSVSEFNPFGQAIETKDALNRYTSSVFGYNQTLATAVAANTRYRQLGYDGFEDYNFQNCSDNHFRLADNTLVTNQDSHTGKYSLLVTASQPLTFNSTLNNSCETPECDIQVSEFRSEQNSSNGTSFIVSASNGTAPYQISPEVISGSPLVALGDQNNEILIEVFSENTVVRLTITDSKGCITIYDFKK